MGGQAKAPASVRRQLAAIMGDLAKAPTEHRS
jgi:hypothetical protein